MSNIILPPGFTTSNELIDTSSAIIDVLEGDPTPYDELLATVDMEKIQLALNFVLSHQRLSDGEKASLLSNSWRLHYKTKPPTPEEFLTERYLGRMAESVYPRVKKWFIEFLDPTKPYRDAVLYPFIGAGKSTLTVLINLYLITHLAMMRDPKKYFGLAPSAILAFVLCSYSLKKSAELLLAPFINILEVSEYFQKVRTKEDMIKREEEFRKSQEVYRVYWTTASVQGTSAIQFSNGLSIKLASSIQSILGLAQPLDSKIQKEDGSYVYMGDLKVGDIIRSPSEGSTTILGIFPQGKIPCYEITLEDERKTRCSPNHLWKVRYIREGEAIEDVVSLQFMLDNPSYEYSIPTLKDSYQSIKSICRLEDLEQQCIYVDSKDHLYITDDEIVTHNTVVCGSLSEISFFSLAGKALALDTLVRMSDGSHKAMRDVKVGDFVMSPTLGCGTEVIAVPWEGEDEAYEIVVSGDKRVVCNANHLWLAKYISLEGGVITKVVTTQFMVDHPEIEFEIPDYYEETLSKKGKL